jgi:hypothetical protein
VLREVEVAGERSSFRIGHAPSYAAMGAFSNSGP